MESLVERKLGLLASRDPATRAYTLGHSLPLVHSLEASVVPSGAQEAHTLAAPGASQAFLGGRLRVLSVHSNATLQPSGSLGSSSRSMRPVPVGGTWVGGRVDGSSVGWGAGETTGNIYSKD